MRNRKTKKNKTRASATYEIIVVDGSIMDILGGHEVLVGTYEEYVLGYSPKEDKSGMSWQPFCVQDFRRR